MRNFLSCVGLSMKLTSCKGLILKLVFLTQIILEISLVATTVLCGAWLTLWFNSICFAFTSTSFFLVHNRSRAAPRISLWVFVTPVFPWLCFSNFCNGGRNCVTKGGGFSFSVLEFLFRHTKPLVTQARQFVGKFYHVSRCIQTYIFRILTLSRSICDYTMSKKCWPLSKILFWTTKPLFAVHFFLATCNICPLF